jgi:crotonobetainyl-CoA:carnitine CoA-transferase CaiB-like acyl-CoA transferase
VRSAVTGVGPLAGLRVIELGMWIAGPATGAILADWGAEVCKVEPPDGDPFRHVMSAQGYSPELPNAPFTLDNRGKRSVTLDLTVPEARTALAELLAGADVFLTNLRLDALGRLDLTPEVLLARHPGLVYGLITGYGSTGPDADRPGYDAGAFGARAGVVHQMRVGDGPPIALPLGFGDHVVALSAAGGICAALLERARTGRGQLVETSLLRNGAYALGWDLGVQLMLGKVPRAIDRAHTPTPMFNCYRCADDHWFWLLGVQADRHFPPVARAIGRPDLITDERFAAARARRQHRSELIAELDSAFAAHPLAHWASCFDAEDVWWAPVQSPAELVSDPQAIANGAFVRVGEGEVRTVATPVDFSAHPRASVGPVPAAGADNADLMGGLPQ